MVKTEKTGDLMAPEPDFGGPDAPAWPEKIPLPFMSLKIMTIMPSASRNDAKIDCNPFVYGDNDAPDKVTIHGLAILLLLRMMEKLDHLGRKGDFQAANYFWLILNFATVLGVFLRAWRCNALV